MLLSWMALGLGIAILPKGISYRHLLILGVVAGVGFTMSLFIAQLAFNDENLLSAAKLGVLVASAAAGLITLLLGRFMLSTHYGDDIAMTADEAESSTEK